MVFPTTAVLDNFNRADNPIGSAWSNGVFGETGAWSVSSNQAGAAGTFNSTWWNAGTFGPDSEVYATLAVVPNNGQLAYLGLRTQTPGSGAADGYELVIVKNAGTDTVNVYRVDNGGQTLLGAAFSQEVAAGDSIGLEVVGSTITLYYKAAAGSWTSLGTRTDATYAGAGYIFMGVQSTVGRWDDFGGGTVVSGSARTGVSAGHGGAEGVTVGAKAASAVSAGHTGGRGTTAGAATRAGVSAGHSGAHGISTGVAVRSGTSAGHAGAHGAAEGSGAQTSSGASAGHAGGHGTSTGVAVRAGTSQGHAGAIAVSVGVPARTGTTEGHAGAHGVATAEAIARTGASEGHAGAHGETSAILPEVIIIPPEANYNICETDFDLEVYVVWPVGVAGAAVPASTAGQILAGCAAPEGTLKPWEI